MSFTQLMGRPLVGSLLNRPFTRHMSTFSTVSIKSPLQIRQSVSQMNQIVQQSSRSITTVLSRRLQPTKLYDLPEAQSKDEAFGSLGVSAPLTQMLISHGITSPTEIQEISIPRLLTGEDGAIGAQTGTGKTLAFVLPIVQQLLRDEARGFTSLPNRPRALIVVPSRELAFQVLAVAKMFCHHEDTRFRAAAVVGGESSFLQKRVLKGETSPHVLRARLFLGKREKDKIIDVVVATGKVLRQLGYEKVSARRIANRTVWSQYLAHISKHADKGYTESKTAEDYRAMRTRAFELAVKIANNDITLDVPFVCDENTIMEAVLKAGNEHNPEEVSAEQVRPLIQEQLEIIRENEEMRKAQEVDAVNAAATAKTNAAAARVVDADVDADVVDEDDYDRSDIEGDLQIEMDGNDVEIDHNSYYDADTDTPENEPDVQGYKTEEERIRDAEAVIRRNRNVDLLVGTPGRLRQMLDEGNLFFSQVRYIAVDEADFMFHPVAGFVEELNFLFAPIRKRLNNHFIDKHGVVPESALTGTELLGNNPVRAMEEQARKIKEGTHVMRTNVFNTQMIFAGASLGGPFMRLVKAMFPLYTEPRYTRKLHNLEASSNLCLPKNLQQTWVRVGARDKLEILADLLSSDKFMLDENSKNKVFTHSVMIFCNSIASCRAVQHHLTNLGVSVVGSHGEIPPRLRREYWSDFLSKRSAVMVCTDLASRGIDTRFISRVINFDFPLSPVDYLHRAGRTARANENGHVINLLVRGDEVLAKAIDNAHKTNGPITTLTADKEAYRTDVAKEFRKDAELYGVTKTQIRVAKQKQHDKREVLNEETRERRRDASADHKLKHQIMTMPWQRTTGRTQVKSNTAVDHMSQDQKKGMKSKVFRDVKSGQTGRQMRKVDKTSDKRRKDARELDEKTKRAKAMGLDGPILSKTQSMKTEMPINIIRQKIEMTMKTTRKRNFRDRQERERNTPVTRYEREE